MKSNMRIQRALRESAYRELMHLGPAVADRMELEAAPDKATVSHYVMTRGAQRAWEAINHQLGASRGALFWIGGQAGSGKTHFLSYVAALASRAGSLGVDAVRNLTLAVEIPGRGKAADLERCLLEAIALELAGEHHQGAALWRELRGAEALGVALDQARRQGVRLIAAVMDLGAADTAPAFEFLRDVAAVAENFKGVRLIAVAAGRGAAPTGASAFDVAPAGAGEMLAVALGRARRLEDASLPLVKDSYRGLDTGDMEPPAIFPFHPAALGVLRALTTADEAVAAMARLVHEILAPWCEARDVHRLVYPVDLMECAAMRKRAEARLGEPGRAALRAAHAVAASLAGDEREAASQLVDTLALHYLSEEDGPLALDEVLTRVPALLSHGRGALPAMLELIASLSARTRGVIAYDKSARGARFNPRAGGAPELAAFNAALALVRRFDSTLTAAQEMPELKAKLKRLADAMASALEGGYRNNETLAAAMHEANSRLSDEQQKIFADFAALSESGPNTLIEIGADDTRRDCAMKTIAAYEALAALAGTVPRLRAMRDYLQATRMVAAYDDDPARDRRLAAIETECQLLMVAVNPAVLAGAARNFDALEARFQKFKWTYVQYYRSLHEQWRVEMGRLAGLAGDAHRHLDALRRLNSIAALGDAEGTDLVERMVAVDVRVVGCDLNGALAPEVTPCCPQCGFVLGTVSPREELNDLFDRARRALQSKLAALSRSAIARLIEQHDHSHRLEGFLRITQAAQTEALIRVLDDKLARYLARLLDENLAACDDNDTARGVVQTFHPARFKRGRGKLDAARRAGKVTPHSSDG